MDFRSTSRTLQTRGQAVLYHDHADGSVQSRFRATHGTETVTRIAQYEMAYWMQTSVPEVMSIANEPPEVHEIYGTQPGKKFFARNFLLACKLAENGIRFIQLYDWGWDSHGSNTSEAINHGFKNKCDSIDKPVFGFDHQRLSFPFQGLDQKLTGVKSANVVKDILA